MSRSILHFLVWGLLLFSGLDVVAQSLLNRLEFGISGLALSDYSDLNSEDVKANPDPNSLKITSQLAFVPAAIIRYNMPYRFAVRGSYFAKETIEPIREYEIYLNEGFVSLDTSEFVDEFQADLKEDFISVVGEFHFNDFNFYQKNSPFVPYLGVGLAHIFRKADVLPEDLIDSLVEFSSNEIKNNGEDLRDDLNRNLNRILNKNRNSIILAFGGKIKLNRLTISGELSSGVLIPVKKGPLKKDDSLEIRQKHKTLLNDWYVFPNFTITYTFGPNF